MTTYIIFKNDGSTNSTNEPGSEEALACEIARRVETMQNQKTSYFAINSMGKHELLEFFMGSALCTVEITAENLKIWKEDFKKKKKFLHLKSKCRKLLPKRCLKLLS